MIAQVTTGFTSAGTLLLPGNSCKLITIQNNGTGSWRLSFDGGANAANSNVGFGGTDPTATTGYLLGAGKEVSVGLAQFPTFGPKPIRGWFVAASGTQVLDICTDDKDSTAPAHA